MSSIQAKDDFKKAESQFNKAKKLYQNQKFTEAKHWLDLALERYQKAQAIFKEAEIYEYKAKISEFENNFQDALKFFQKAADLRIFQENPVIQGEIHQNLARCLLHLKSYDKALSHALNAYDLFESVEISIKNAEIVYLISQIYYAQGDLKSSEFYLKLAIDLLQSNSHPQLELFVLENYANVLFKLGNFIQAERYFLQALKREHELKNFHIVLNLLSPLIEIYLEYDDFSEARKYLTDFIKIIQEIKPTLELKEQSTFYLKISEFYFYLGNYSLAEQYCEDAIEANERQKSPNQVLLSRQLFHMAKIQLNLHKTDIEFNLDLIIPYLNEAEQLAQANNEFHIQFEILLIKERAARLQGNLKKANEFLETAFSLAQNPSHPDFLGIALIWEQKATFEHKKGNYEKAQEFFLKALENFQLSKYNRRLGEIYYNLACVSACLHLPEDVLMYLEKAVNLNPKFRKLAKNDEDFHGLHQNELFLRLIES
ncbi:MAG: tetratricopeptide repeat protein [Candidatus Lokiarchaeota archaeon]|nr:tetratricopeptide repeat protein [Candidatus Harpocratesius repetitus]